MTCKTFTPHPYQQYCINRIVESPTVGLFLDMGLGKTAITLMAIRCLKFDCWAVNRVLVVAPKKVAEATWQNEAATWKQTQGLRVVEVLGAEAHRRRVLATQADVYVINRENIPWLVQECGRAWPFDMVVLDESSTPVTTTVATSGNTSGGGKNANITTGTQTGTAGDKQLYAEFAPNGAKSATLYYTISTKDTNSSGAFGTWTGSWEQTDFDVTVGSNGQCTADYVIPSNVGQTVKAMVFYPDASSVKIDKVVLHYGNVTPGTTTAQPSSGGKYTKDLNQAIVYEDLPAGDKMLGWKWSDLGVPAGEKVTKVEINLSTSKKQIGKWQGAFGSSTSVAPDYWTQSEDMEQTISGKTGSIVWDVDSATSAIIQTQYGGELKFGVWWIDCNKFTIDSITVYTDAYSGSGQTTTTVSTTKATTTTNKTTASTTTTTKQTTTATNGPKPSVKASLYGDVNLDGRVDITDAVLLNKKVAGVVILNDQQYANADCCTDDGVGQADSTVLLQFLVSIVKTLPAEG